jgi:hypothetical protein
LKLVDLDLVEKGKYLEYNFIYVTLQLLCECSNLEEIMG